MSCAVVTLQRDTCHNKPIPGDLKCVLTGTASSTNKLYSPCVQTHPSVAKIAAETPRWWVPSVPTPVGIASWLHSRLKQKHPFKLCSAHTCQNVVVVLSERETPGDASMHCSHLWERRHGYTPGWNRKTLIMRSRSVHTCRSIVMVTLQSETETTRDECPAILTRVEVSP